LPISFLVWYASHSYWHTAQPDGWTAMLLAAAVLPMVGRDRATGAARAAAMGLAIGAATMVKPVYAAFLLVPLLGVRRLESRRDAERSMAPVVVAWLVSIGLVAGWFALHGALDEAIDVYLRYPAIAYVGIGSPDLGARARGLAEYLLDARVVTVGLPLVVVGAVSLLRTRAADGRVAVGWLAIAVGAVVLQGRFFAYHWLPVLPAAVVLGAVGFQVVRDKARLVAVVMASAVAIHAAVPVAWEETRFLSWLTGRLGTTAYYDAFGEPGAELRAVSWLEDAPPGPIYVFGWNTGVAWLARRPTISRFGFSLPLLVDAGDFRARYRREVMTALETAPARFIIVGTQSERILGGRLSVDDFPELADLLAREYAPAWSTGPIVIHQRLVWP
jgi:hypothetical protein